MSTPEVGPYRTLGGETPFYIVQFDKNGGQLSPETGSEALAVAASDRYSDVVVFSHGWNNDWDAATEKYDGFVNGCEGLFARERPGEVLLLGVFWPSAILVMPQEQAPRMAAGDNEGPLDKATRDEVKQLVGAAAMARVEELCAKGTVDEAETVELAELLAPAFSGRDDELGDSVVEPAPEDLASSWLSSPPFAGLAAASTEMQDEDWGTADGTHGGPKAAAIWDRINPRDVVRAATVWMMKDRAGRVGAHGVGPLLRQVLASSDAHVHLIGHSYGGKVVLSALCAEAVPRSVHSVLLLQPAVNHQCFADLVQRTGKPGGFRLALSRVERPILSTYSANDVPLTKFFHFALRRKGDLGEPMFAAWPEPPSVFAALGGYGPRGADADTQFVDLLDPPSAYNLDPERKLAAVNGTKTIGGHSDISVPATWWALHELMRA